MFPGCWSVNHAIRQPRRYLHPGDGVWRVQITQGETFVTTQPDELLTTVLGSCVAACIRDPLARVGGMNHFLLPGSEGDDKHAIYYGINAMELLINGMMQHGAQRNRMEAKLFGGANVMASLTDIGTRNGEFAIRYLVQEGIRHAGGDLGGNSPRKIEYWPLTGRARQMLVGGDSEELVRHEIALAPQQGDVELF
jgi:chemotaxis protein CheD